MRTLSQTIHYFVVGISGVLLLFQTGCATLTEVGVAVAQGVGVVTSDEAKGIKKSAQAVGKTFKDITPEQEYYIGRAVAASILTQYKPYSDPALEAYVNQVGQALALASIKPQTFKGYHFMIFESDEMNAFACPGGFIMVSKGILELCENEDQLAAVLAHEIAHVQFGHGLKAIKKGRLTGALTTIAAEGAKAFAGEAIASITDAFEDSIGDITSTMVNKGYARKQEYQADEGGIAILKAVGYDPNALEATLHAMSHDHGDHDHAEKKKGFGATHPPTSDRIAKASAIVGEVAESKGANARAKRFAKATKNL